MTASLGENDGKPELEWHVEARDSSAEADATQIMKRVVALSQQLQDASETSLWTWDLDRRPRP